MIDWTFFLIGMLLLLLTGPVAGLVYVRLVRVRRGVMAFLAFWAALLLLTFGEGLWLTGGADSFFAIYQLAACTFLPACAVLTLLVFRLAWGRARLRGELLPGDGRRYWAGALLIAGLQLAFLAAWLLFGPELCRLGLYACTDW